jgi:hypothetical protein
LLLALATLAQQQDQPEWLQEVLEVELSCWAVLHLRQLVDCQGAAERRALSECSSQPLPQGKSRGFTQAKTGPEIKLKQPQKTLGTVDWPLRPLRPGVPVEPK